PWHFCLGMHHTKHLEKTTAVDELKLLDSAEVFDAPRSIHRASCESTCSTHVNAFPLLSEHHGTDKCPDEFDTFGGLGLRSPLDLDDLLLVSIHENEIYTAVACASDVEYFTVEVVTEHRSDELLHLLRMDAVEKFRTPPKGEPQRIQRHGTRICTEGPEQSKSMKITKDAVTTTEVSRGRQGIAPPATAATREYSFYLIVASTSVLNMVDGTIHARLTESTEIASLTEKAALDGGS
ncbi:MAG TPA: hypothetical protein VFQ76_04380, partial [Longimicrobiaceae bacterium]|nr:hypothetical protein [Longimicrobiaceae bacterium]